MQFYSFSLKNFEGISHDERGQAEREFRASLCDQTNSVITKSDVNEFVCVSNIRDSFLSGCAILKKEADINALVSRFIEDAGLKNGEITIEECTIKEAYSRIKQADRSSYVYDAHAIYGLYNIDEICDNYSFSFGEGIIDTGMSYKSIYQKASELLIGDSFKPELKRIFAKSGKTRFKGHPAHYLITENDNDRRRDTVRLLLSSLYENKRIKTKRYSFIDIDEEANTKTSCYSSLYESCENGAVCIRFCLNEDSEMSARIENALEAALSQAYKYRRSVLTVLCIRKGCNALKEKILSELKTMSVVEIKNDIISSEKANKYLRLLCRENGVSPNNELLIRGGAESTLYTVKELDFRFDEWYDSSLRKKQYKSYSQMSSAKNELAKNAPKGSAYSELMELIGLKNAKEIISSALDYFKAQKIFADKGMVGSRPAMHMVFTGNPGTAKTTVARLFSRIMKENGILENGDIYELGRADLVGKYVGHTAPIVKRAFEKAKGSVLFIDEAYSLVDDKDGLYGDEAINTIVQEMENNRSDIVVIFAGYPDKMEGFLNKNPGLRSRIAFHIPFDDYSSSELYSIAELEAKRNGLAFGEGVENKLVPIFELARKSGDFGNGRYARNLIERAKMAQARRLLSENYSTLTSLDVATLLPEDFKALEIGLPRIERKMGFAG